MNDPEIEVRLLRCLTVLVEVCSVSRAAERLGTSQPAMSHSLARLRQIFGDPILTRSKSGLVPTARAVELDGVARSVLNDLDRMSNVSVPFDPKTSTTTFVLTATEYVESVLAAKFVTALQDEAPHVKVEFRPPDRSQAMAWMERGEIDLRLGYVHEPDPILRSKLLFEEKLVVVARADHPEIRGAITLTQYQATRHVTSELAGWTTSGRAIDKALGDIHSQREKQVHVQSALTIPRVVAGSDLVATVPEGLARGAARDLGLQVLGIPIKVSPFRCAAYWHESVHRDPRHKWLRTILIRVARLAEEARAEDRSNQS
jgi:DNA-binding transcriptional LysR family regulator